MVVTKYPIRATIRKKGTSSIITIPAHYISQGIVRQGRTYQFSVEVNR